MNKVHYLEAWEDCDGEPQVTPNVKYILNCIEEGGGKLQIALYETNGSCSSGYCNASWGEYDVNWVEEFGGYTHSPNKNIEFSMEFTFDRKDYKWVPAILSFGSCDGYGIEVDNVFWANGDGGDCYYPGGTVYVNEDLFTPNSRYIGKPFVYIFYGDSATGKSFLSGKLKNSNEYIVYETDTHNALPEKIEAEIIVVGNKYNIDLNDVKRRIPFDTHIVEVNFKS